MKNFIIVRSGNTWPKVAEQFGEFENHFLNSITAKPESLLVIKSQENPTYPAVDDIAGVIVSGAHENVTDYLPWMQDLAKWINKIHQANIPMLGVCFGHQIIGKALGGKVGFNPNGEEYGLFKLTMKNEHVIFGLELPKEFNVYATHSQSIIELPANAVSYVTSKLDPNHLVYFGNSSWGFQFHPEFSYELTQTYIKAMPKAMSLGNQQQQLAAEEMGQMLLNAFVKSCQL